MKRLNIFGYVVVAALAGSAWVSPAAADGVLTAPQRLTATNRATLTMAIAHARKTEPEAFARVARAREVALRAAQSRHGRLPTMAPQLKSLGKPALLPMLEMIAIDAPARGSMPAPAWLALRVGLLEAVGVQRDPRAIPVLVAVLDEPSTEPEVTRAAAEALARTGTDAAAAKLIALSSTSGRKQLAVIDGMGECRRLVVAQHLSQWLGRRPPPELALALVRTLGRVANAWAWQTPGMAQAEEDRTRELAAQTLVEAFVAYDGLVREAAGKGLLLADHPSTMERVEAAHVAASSDELRAALENLARKLAGNPVH